MTFVAFVDPPGGGGGPLGFVVYEGENTAPSGGVSGAPVTARAAFLARLTVTGAIDFESGFSDFDPLDGASASSNGTTATFASFDGNTVALSIAPNGGIYNTTSGGAFYGQVAFGDPCSIAFSAPVAAFGLFITDPGDIGGQVTITCHKQGGGTEVVNVTHAISGASGNLVWWSFVDDTGTLYTSVDITCDVTGEAIGIDDIVLATAAQLA